MHARHAQDFQKWLFARASGGSVLGRSRDRRRNTLEFPQDVKSDWVHILDRNGQVSARFAESLVLLSCCRNRSSRSL